MNIFKKVITGLTLALAVTSSALANEPVNKEKSLNVSDILTEALSGTLCRNFPPYCDGIVDTIIIDKNTASKANEDTETLRKRK